MPKQDDSFPMLFFSVHKWKVPAGLRYYGNIFDHTGESLETTCLHKTEEDAITQARAMIGITASDYKKYLDGVLDDETKDFLDKETE